MLAMTRIARWSLMPLVLLTLVPWRSAGAQLGGLIRRSAERAAAPALPPTGPPPVFTGDMLELTPERIAQVIAGKAAAEKAREGPNGSPAIRRRIESLDERQGALYERHVEAIHAWDETRRGVENCRDSILIAAVDRNRSRSAGEFLERNRQLGLDYAAALQRGDSAEARRLAGRMTQLDQPSRADTLAAERSCGAPAPPAAVAEWGRLKGEIEGLQQALHNAEAAERAVEEQASGMNQRQIALACERALLYIWRAERRQPQQGLTPAELEALEQARKDLARYCGP